MSKVKANVKAKAKRRPDNRRRIYHSALMQEKAIQGKLKANIDKIAPAEQHAE
ncbi:hypothetical protein [Colwellia psychrerythraea]|nr:hypothetical protein [Colwellia psychrerythraea]